MLNELQPLRSVRKQGERCYKYGKVRERQQQAEAHYLMGNRRGTDDLEKADVFNAFLLQFSPTKKVLHCDIKMARHKTEEEKNRQVRTWLNGIYSPEGVKESRQLGGGTDIISVFKEERKVELNKAVSPNTSRKGTGIKHNQTVHT